MLPQTTRLRWVSAKNKDLIVQFCDTLGVRIQIIDLEQDNSGDWVLWFVPSDTGADIKSGKLSVKPKGV